MRVVKVNFSLRNLPQKYLFLPQCCVEHIKKFMNVNKIRRTQWSRHRKDSTTKESSETYLFWCPHEPWTCYLNRCILSFEITDQQLQYFFLMCWYTLYWRISMCFLDLQKFLRKKKMNFTKTSDIVFVNNMKHDNHKRKTVGWVLSGSKWVVEKLVQEGEIQKVLLAFATNECCEAGNSGLVTKAKPWNLLHPDRLTIHRQRNIMKSLRSATSRQMFLCYMLEAFRLTNIRTYITNYLIPHNAG